MYDMGVEAVLDQSQQTHNGKGPPPVLGRTFHPGVGMGYIVGLETEFLAEDDSGEVVVS